MIQKILLALICLSSPLIAAQHRQPIIDMHIHAYGEARESGNYGSMGPYGLIGSMNQQLHFNETYGRFKKYNIVKAVVSGSPQSIESWEEWDKENRVIPALYMNSPTDHEITPALFEELVKAKKVEVFGEIGAYYSGTTLSDSEWDPYLEICARYDIPVAVHTGGGASGGTYSWAPSGMPRSF